MLEDYLNFIQEARTIHPMQYREMLRKQIMGLMKKKQKKCPKSKEPAICQQKYDKKIASKKKHLSKLSNLRFSSLSGREKKANVELNVK